MKKLLKIPHLLSLDVAVGAVAGGIFFNPASSKILYVSLGLSTWIWYLLDRLFDANSDHDLHTERHDFHRKYTPEIALMVGFLVIINLFLIFNLKEAILINGLLITGLMVIYGFSVLKFKGTRFEYFKEFFVATLYTAGISIDASVHPLWMIFYGLAVWQSLLIFSYFETLENQSVRNIATALGYTKIKRIQQLILLVFFVLLAIQPTPRTLVLTAIVFVNFSIFIFHKNLVNNGLYRILGELAFWFPLFLIV